jgi:hypothetical protein
VHIGIHQTFVNRVRNEPKTVLSSSPEPVTRIGDDGKMRRATYRKRQPDAWSRGSSSRFAWQQRNGIGLAGIRERATAVDVRTVFLLT